MINIVDVTHKHMMLIVFVLVFLFVVNTSSIDYINKSNAEAYFKKFGYITTSDNDNNTESLIHVNENETFFEALTAFQEYYHLPTQDGINNDTINFMSMPRCGVPDNPTGLNYKISTTKWHKSDLTWHFALATYELKQIATEAFKVWERANTNLKFTYVSSNNADITISFGQRGVYHRYASCNKMHTCSSPFDGTGKVLAHATFPTTQNACVEIHLDPDEDWYFPPIHPPSGKISLLQVLVHEIGHALGLEHSRNPLSLMFAVYFYPNNGINLDSDDIQGIQYLYGMKKAHSATTTPTPTTTTIPTTKISIPKKNAKNATDVPKDLCDIQFKQNAYLIVKHSLFVIYNKWAWIINLQTNQLISNNSISIKDYIRHSDLTNLSLIYQRPNNELVVFDRHIYHRVDGSSFQIKESKTIDAIGLNVNSNIQGVFSTYTGKTFIFYDNNFFAEIDECTFRVKEFGTISEKFNGIPNKISGAFRYTNGHIYFFQNNIYFEYNEFTNSLIKTGKSSDLFTTLTGIQCPNVSVLSQLKSLLNKLLQNHARID